MNLDAGQSLTITKAIIELIDSSGGSEEAFIDELAEDGEVLSA